MRFTETPVHGAFVVEPELLEDDRGFFARVWCREEFARHGLNPKLAQCSISFNRSRGTLRGLHYQLAPHEEAKLVRVTMGAVHDVVVDLRPGSPTFGAQLAAELSSRNRRMLYVPEGCAHGFLTLEDDTEVAYQMTEMHAPGAGLGVRFDDPAFAIPWPGEVRVIAERDRTYPDVELAR